MRSVGKRKPSRWLRRGCRCAAGSATGTQLFGCGQRLGGKMCRQGWTNCLLRLGTCDLLCDGMGHPLPCCCRPQPIHVSARPCSVPPTSCPSCGSSTKRCKRAPSSSGSSRLAVTAARVQPLQQQQKQRQSACTNRLPPCRRSWMQRSRRRPRLGSRPLLPQRRLRRRRRRRTRGWLPRRPPRC